MRNKQKKTKKLECSFMLKLGCARERITRKIKIHKKQTTYIIQITETSTNRMFFLKVKCYQICYNISFSCKSCFLSCHLKVKIPENLMQCVTEELSFESTNIKKHFPADELILGKNICALLNSQKRSFLPLYSLQLIYFKKHIV